jgi:hypothetical protein
LRSQGLRALGSQIRFPPPHPLSHWSLTRVSKTRGKWAGPTYYMPPSRLYAKKAWKKQPNALRKGPYLLRFMRNHARHKVTSLVSAIMYLGPALQTGPLYWAPFHLRIGQAPVRYHTRFRFHLARWLCCFQLSVLAYVIINVPSSHHSDHIHLVCLVSPFV